MNKKFLSSCLAIGMIAAAQFMSSCSKDSNEDSYKPIEGAVINQEEAKKGYMTMVSTSNDQQIRLYIYAEEADRTDIWIDLNNNGKKDNGEADINFDDYATYSFGDPIITIYGKVIALACEKSNLTKLDVSQNTNLGYLYCIDNPFADVLSVVKSLPDRNGKKTGEILIEESDAITKILKEKNWEYYEPQPQPI